MKILSQQQFIVKIDILKKQIFSTIFPARISNILKYFLSETIHAQENGSRGTHFAKFLISNFLKGLAYSALVLNSNHEFDGFELLHLTCSQYTNKKHKKADKQVIHKEYICHFSTVPTEPPSK